MGRYSFILLAQLTFVTDSTLLRLSKIFGNCCIIIPGFTGSYLRTKIAVVVNRTELGSCKVIVVKAASDDIGQFLIISFKSFSLR